MSQTTAVISACPPHGLHLAYQLLEVLVWLRRLPILGACRRSSAGCLSRCLLTVSPHIAAHAEAMSTGSGEERFEFGLNVLVTGLEAVSATFPPVDGPAEQAQ